MTQPITKGVAALSGAPTSFPNEIHHQTNEHRSAIINGQLYQCISRSPLQDLFSGLYNAFCCSQSCISDPTRKPADAAQLVRTVGKKAKSRGVDGMTLYSLKQLMTSHQSEIRLLSLSYTRSLLRNPTLLSLNPVISSVTDPFRATRMAAQSVVDAGVL